MSRTDDVEVIVVTGGTGGLGQALVPALLNSGYHVVVPYRSKEDFALLERRVGPGNLSGLHVDLLDREEVDKALATILEPIYALIHLTGGFAMGSIENGNPDLWQQMFASNVLTLLHVARAVIPRIRAAGSGRVITVASSSVGSAPAGLGAYTSAKRAVVAFTETLAHELAGTHVTANVLLPGTLDTEANKQQPETERVSLAHVIETIKFLLSPVSAGITGAAIPITIAKR
ncbi:MAG: 3-oxoacyl-ACP reductase FabG [Herpetosiphon sp.]